MEKIKDTERKNKNLYVTFRIFQAIFLGIFALGLSSGIGDYFKYVELPISNFSVMTTIFGLIGAIITEGEAKSSERW